MKDKIQKMEKSDLFQTRMLGLPDLSRVIELYKTHNTHMGVSNENYHELLTDVTVLEQYLSPEFKDKVLFGTFLNDNLVLSMGIYFWPSLPCCTFLRFASLKGTFSARTIREPFRSLYGACLNHMEDQNYNRFYLITSAKHQEMLAYIGATWEQFQSKYVMAVEEVIPTHSRARFEAFWDMMGHKTWPVPVIARSGTLLNTYRKFDTDIVTKATLKIWENTGRGPEESN